MATNNEMAELSWPILCEYAQARRTLTYEELKDRVGAGVARGYGRVLERVRDETIRRGLPMLTAIVLNKNQGFPGDDWHPDPTFYGRLSEEEKQRLFKDELAKVFAYAGWDSVLLYRGTSPVPIKKRVVQPAEGYGWGGGESEAHRELKAHIQKHPELVGVQKVESSTTEFLLPSGDEVDVYFKIEDGGVEVVEVKTTDPDEIRRGVFQAIKYRVLAAAHLKRDLDSPTVRGHLVATAEFPAEVQEVAGRYGVLLHQVRNVAAGERT